MSEQASFFRQPKSVWATAFAAMVGFMSIGLVDPILVSIAQGLDATPSEVSLLFTSYFFVTAVMMLITGFVSSRIGGRATLLVGAALIVVFAALSGTANSVTELVLFRAGWGLGNALFVATALSVIVGAARGGSYLAILLYEAALGLGISLGPLLGAALGAMSWRYPFFGTATLMAIGFIAIAVFLPKQPKPAHTTGILDPIRALGNPGLKTTAVAAFFYNFGFFTVLAFTPFVLNMSPQRSAPSSAAGASSSPSSRSSSRRACRPATAPSPWRSSASASSRSCSSSSPSAHRHQSLPRSSCRVR